MKQVKTLLIAVTMFIAGNQVINAQSKTAHVEVGEIMAKMPAMLEAQKQLGFAAVGVARAEPGPAVEKLREWLAAGN